MTTIIESAFTEAIGFAIPINSARAVLEVLKEGKKPTHAFFGVELVSLTPDTARINVRSLASISNSLTSLSCRHTLE
jgi:S1-C subfamily serine protease